MKRARSWSNHLVDPVGYRVGEVLDIFSKAAHAPKMNLFINAALQGTGVACPDLHDYERTMSLVRTPMIAPTDLYNNVPTLSPEEAADLIVQACIFRPVRIATRMGIAGQMLHAALPRVAQIVMNTSFRMFPDSPAAQGTKKGERPDQARLSPEAMAMQHLMQGIHF